MLPKGSEQAAAAAARSAKATSFGRILILFSFCKYCFTAKKRKKKKENGIISYGVNQSNQTLI